MTSTTATHAMQFSSLGRAAQHLNLADETPCIEVQDMHLYYGETEALKGISMQIPKKRITAFIGPSGCGKSTLLRSFNRMNDLVDGVRIEGKVTLDGHDIYGKDVDVADLRRRVGMVFQKPNPFPKSIYENVAYGLRIQGIKNKRLLDETVEWALRSAALWDETKDRLHESALGMSGGQQQRVFIARSLAQQADIYLMDEPFVGIDAASEEAIMKLLTEMRGEGKTVVLVHHDLHTAVEFFDWTILLNTRLVAAGPTDEVMSEENLRIAYGGRLNVLSRVADLIRAKEYPMREKDLTDS